MKNLTRKQKHKVVEFVSLCSSLTKQGFQFDIQKGIWCGLVFSHLEAKRLFHPDTKTPYVTGFYRIAHDKKKICYQFEQWSGR